MLILDHVHFQYNGMLLGVLLGAIAALQSRRHGLAAFLFTCLLWMKHIFLVLAPLVFVYLLRHHCFEEEEEEEE